MGEHAKKRKAENLQGGTNRTAKAPETLRHVNIRVEITEIAYA